jgi:hypothetical protein
MIQVLVFVSNPRRLLMELTRILQVTINEMIPNLAFCVAVLCDGGSNTNYEPSSLENAHLAVLSGENGLIERCSKGLDFDAGEGPQSAVEIRRKFHIWIPPSGLRMTGYHVFLSYRWTGVDRQHLGFDEDLTMGIFQKLSMDALIGPHKEEVNVFLDKQRLQPARDFQSDFADALLSSSLPVIVMSSAALLKMVSLEASSFIDNLLLEWTIIADLKASGVIKHCLVVLFGAHNKLAGSCADVLGDIFEQKVTHVLEAVEGDQSYDKARRTLFSVPNLDSKTIFELLPNVAVKRINDKARSILQEHEMPVSPGLDSRSVRDVVDSLRYSLGVKAWEQAKNGNSSHVNEEVLRAVIKCCSDTVCSVLEQDKPLCPRAAHAASSAAAAQGDHVMGGGDSAVPSQQQECTGTEDAIIRRLVDVLARAEIAPIPKRQQFAQALYGIGITNQQQLKDSVVGESPDVDLESQDVGMNRIQKKALMKFLTASQP